MTRRWKKIQEAREARAPKAKPQKEAENQYLPITKELALQFNRLQGAKTRLCKKLRELQREPVIVQLELTEKGWIFLVRGSAPVYAVWEGVECKYVEGVFDLGMPAHQARTS